MKTEGSSLVKQLVERLRNREELDLEAKRCEGGIPDSLWETVSAFANTRGGWIVLGIEDNGDVCGVKNPPAIIKHLFDEGRNPKKINREVWTEADIFEDVIEEKMVVVVRVPETPHSGRPVFINGKHVGGTYLRRDGGDYRCTQDEVYRMIRDANPSGGDSSAIEKLHPDNLSQETIAAFRQRFQNREPASPFNNYPRDKFLSAIGALDRNGNVTIAGLLMFGEAQDILRWRKHHLIDYRLNAASVYDPTWQDRIAADGNLFTSFLQIYPKLVSLATRPHQVIDAVQAGEGPIQLALREAFVNLLVHADYKENDPSLVIHAPEGYLFRNPGASLIPLDDLLYGNRSTPRNPTLHRMFRLIGLVDQAGTGFPKILQAWREQGFEMPNLEIENERYEFKLLLRNIHLVTEEDRAWLMGLSINLKNEEQLALVLAKGEGSVNPEILGSKLAIHVNDAMPFLLHLESLGFLSRDYRNGREKFILTPQSIQPLRENVTNVGKSITENEENVTEDQEDLFDEPEIREFVQNELGKRETRVERRAFIEDYILKLCTETPKTASQLARIFEIRRETLFREYMKPLISGGKLMPQGSRGSYRSAR